MTGLWFSDVHGPDETALHAWFDLRVAVAAVDRPGDPPLSWSWHVGTVRQPWPGMEVHSFLAHDDDTLVGWCTLMPSLTENRDTAPSSCVHPRHRRHGLGRAMLREAGRRAADLGRTRLVAEAVTDGPGAAFAAAVGARAALADTQRRLDLRTVDESRARRAVRRRRGARRWVLAAALDRGHAGGARRPDRRAGRAG